MENKLAGTSSSSRTLDQRDLASMRPAPAPKPRAQRKPSALREVTNGIICECGERFYEHQALEFMLHYRAEVGEDLEVLRRYRDSQRRHHEKEKERYWEDDEYRAKVLARGRSSYVPKPRKQVPAACGTYAGYSRHRRQGETACAACKEAVAMYQRGRPGKTFNTKPYRPYRKE